MVESSVRMLPPGRERFGFSQTRKPSRESFECGRRQGKGKVTNRRKRYSRSHIQDKQGPQGVVDCAPFLKCAARGIRIMGKGDRRSRRGKIYRGSFGKTRAKDPTKKKKAAAKK